MSISEKDREFLESVASFFRETKKCDSKEEGSILTTARHFGINRNKVRKILVTTGDISNPLTEKAVELRKEGCKIDEIADKLGVSKATVSTYLPYDTTIKNTLDPSPHTGKVREYRKYEKDRKERQKIKMEEVNEERTSWKDEWKKEAKMSYTPSFSRRKRVTWEDLNLSDEYFASKNEKLIRMRKEYEELKEKEDLTQEEETRLLNYMLIYGDIPGLVSQRSVEDLERISGERLPAEPYDVMRLNMELVCDDEDEKEVFKKYGSVKYGDTISRDCLVPINIPLYAVHYLIQRLFGWQNSHLHSFELDEDVRDRVTCDKLSVWAELVGILFRSPFMDENAQFWADDYRGGSFKNWMTKKYTGPYYSRCTDEGYIKSQKTFSPVKKDLKKNSEYYVLWEVDENGKRIRLLDERPVINYVGAKMESPQSFWKNYKTELEIVRAEDAPVSRLDFDTCNTFDLLERLPIISVISFLPDFDMTGKDFLLSVHDDIEKLKKEKSTDLLKEILPCAFTNSLIYRYDYGDGWKVRITATGDCLDLIKDGRITQEELDKAQIKCRELYRPVTIAVDGEMLLDDVGGTSGYADFLKTINDDYKNDDEYVPDKDIEREMKIEKRETLNWAKNVQSWKKLSPYI